MEIKSEENAKLNRYQKIMNKSVYGSEEYKRASAYYTHLCKIIRERSASELKSELIKNQKSIYD